MRLVALLGDPVAHSLSPLLQNAAFRAADLEGTYLALRVDRQDLEGLLNGIARAGGAGNVTLPHKEQAAQVVERLLPAAERTRACNTFWLEEGRVVGDNTDVDGFRQAVRRLLGREATGLRVLLLGAGGAARAVLHALVEDGGDVIWIRNRSPERARELAATLGEGRARVWDGAASAPGEVDLVVNATRLGMGAGDPLPLSAHELPPGEPACLDLVYRPDETAWVRGMRALGLPAEDGGEMLVQQGAAAFVRWWGRPAPLEVMRQALARARDPVESGEGGRG